MQPRSSVPTIYRHDYGIDAGQKLTRPQLESIAFVEGIKPPVGLGRYGHLLKLIGLWWPRELQPDRWNPWTELTLKELCNDETAIQSGGVRVKSTVLTGCATGSKTWTCGWYAFEFWCASPHNSIVIFTSTTKEMIRRRIWPVVQHFYDHGPDKPWPFNKVESRTTVQCVDPATKTPSDKHAIFALAVAHGETQKAAHNLRGMHAERVLLVIDEANGTPEAIFETIPNLRKGCKNFETIIIGNPVSRLDPHGQAMTPADGWSIVTSDRYRWKTKGVDKWQLEPGICLRYDGADSPNVRLGKDQWPFIYSNADWKRACAPEKEKTLAYWSQDRGLHPPEGFCHTVISETMLEKYDPADVAPFRWLSHRKIIAALDPAFGGDECKLYFAELGDISEGKEGVQIIGNMTLSFEEASRDEIDYLIARQTIDECKRRGVTPECFGLDRTGTGRGVAAIIAAEWSSSIRQIEFGEMATERPSSTADGRPAREVYANRVTEMWWSVREFLEAGQLRGLPQQARIEFCTREYTWAGRRYKLESKDDCKLRLGYSPDDGDSVGLLLDVARSQGAGARTRNVLSEDTAWNSVVEKKVKEAEHEAEFAMSGEDAKPAYNPHGITDMFDNPIGDEGW